MDIAESIRVLRNSDVRSVLGKTEVKRELDFYRRCFICANNTLSLVKAKVVNSPQPLTLLAGGLLRESLRIAEHGNTAVAVNINGHDFYKSYSDDLQEKERGMTDRYLDSGRILLVEGNIFEANDMFGTRAFDEVYATGM